MRPRDDIEKIINQFTIDVNPKKDQAIFEELQIAQAISKASRPGILWIDVWRIIMKTKMTSIAVAAVIVLAVIISMTMFDNSMPSAYAIEQTIQASHSVQYLHIRTITFSHEDEPVEFWVEFALNGQPENMRLNLPDWMAPGGGPREVIWKDNKVQEWLKEKNTLIAKDDEASANQVLKMIENLDPKLAVTRLQEKQEQGKVELEIIEPTDKAEPIIVTATSTKEDDSSFQRMVLYIDQATRLVNVIEFYRLSDGDYEYIRTLEYYDYNQPIDAEMFMFSDVSSDAEQIDFMTMGLAQGNRSKEEIAVEVVRQLFDALMAPDYNRASKLYPGKPVDQMKEMFSELTIIRIVSIGKPILRSETDGVRVPFDIEVEMNGKISRQQGELSVHHLAGLPDRWVITGGF